MSTQYVLSIKDTIEKNFIIILTVHFEPLKRGQPLYKGPVPRCPLNGAPLYHTQVTQYVLAVNNLIVTQSVYLSLCTVQVQCTVYILISL